MASRILLILALLTQPLAALPCGAAVVDSGGGGRSCQAGTDQESCCCPTNQVAACPCAAELPFPRPAGSDAARTEAELAKALLVSATTAQEINGFPPFTTLGDLDSIWQATLDGHERCVLLCRWLK